MKKEEGVSLLLCCCVYKTDDVCIRRFFGIRDGLHIQNSFCFPLCNG